MKQQLLSGIIFIIFVLFGSVFAQKTSAASLGSLKDTITTSRPSAASPLSANAATGVGQLSIFDNGSRFLASDSAKIINGLGAFTNTGLIVASQSAALTTVYLGNVTTAPAGAGADVLINPITATHTISFTTPSTIPIGGHIVITFPGAANNTASPSATTFAFNNLNNTNTAWDGTSTPIMTNNVTCGAASDVAAPTLDCTTTTAAVTAGTTVTIMIGCTAQSGGVCTAGSPRLINPTVSSSGVCAPGVNPITTSCTADTWRISVATTDGTNPLDSGSTKIAIIDSVQVQATVEPTLTFIISGLVNGTNINTITGCTGSITTNSGIDSTATSVNLGVLSNGYTSKAAQRLRVSTNAATGYVITATSSGQFKNPATGAIILDANGGTGLTANDTPAPATITNGTPAFGIHACGARSNVNTDQWVVAGTMPDTGAGTARFSNPWNTGANAFYNTIASYTGGPVTDDDTAILYASTISGLTPAGIYQTTMTYVATATF